MAQISVVIPLYNKAKYVGRAINSVLSQTFHDFEIIVINDASIDGSEKIVGQYKDERIKTFNRNTPSPGGHAARNLGIEKASAELIAFLDADDEWMPQFLETILRLRENYPGAGAYATAYKQKSIHGRIRTPRFWYIPKSREWEGILPDYFRSSLYGTTPVWTSAVAIPREIFASAGFFPEGVPKGGDLDMWARIALKYNIAYSNHTGAIYHKDVPGSIVRTIRTSGRARVVETVEHFLKGNNDISQLRRQYLHEYANKFRISSAAHCIKAGNIELAVKQLQECHTRKFLCRKTWLYLKIFLLKYQKQYRKFYKNENSN